MRTPLTEAERKLGLETAQRLKSFWTFHRGFDANMKDLARETGVSRDTVYRWLKGKGIPRLEKARRIEEWLKIRTAAERR
ncbi:MAG: helix-turn-helix domain-containing protein [Candidatus Aureabacteria bacterium]|nr:helix-turn-helix domain-containing protein [Candidatus Auribacterota bacterium]